MAAKPAVGRPTGSHRPAPAAPGRRLPAAERRREMALGAAALFAASGFAVSTRDIAAHLGVAQALIYRHFRSKSDLVDAAIEECFSGQAAIAWSAILSDAGRPLAERIADGYTAFAARSDEVRLRLFIRAGLEGSSVVARRGAALTRLIFEPLVAALRQQAGLPGFDRVEMMRGERELAMMLHGAVVFLGIRRHVYAMPMAEDGAAVVRLYAEAFAAGAPAALRGLHQGLAGASLTVAQLAPRAPISGRPPHS
jgi:AcrR family transcriptional regulator